MNRLLSRFNALGVLALTALCVLQWRTNRNLNLEINRREQTHLDQTTLLLQQTRTVQGQAGDLANLRAHLDRLTRETDQTAANLAAAQRQLQQARAAGDQLRSSVSNWAAAVAARDRQIEEHAARIRALANERNDTVNQFNELAVRHNQLVKDFDSLRQQFAVRQTNQPPPTRLPENSPPPR